MAKRKFKVVFKYEGEGWQIYDETFVEAWADTQRQRAESEHGRRGATVKVVRDK